MVFQIRPLDASVDTTSFQCGREPLDDYIRRYASQDVRRNVARVFVVVPGNNPQQLAGFFTLSAGSVSCISLPASLVRKLPRYPVPVALIGRLAVDSAFQGKGLGSNLLADACHKVSQASTVRPLLESSLMLKMMKPSHSISISVSSLYRDKQTG